MDDLTGRRFGKLVVLNKLDKRDKYRNIIWKCKCDCGNEIKVRGTSLCREMTKSCGCLRKEFWRNIGKEKINENNNFWKGGYRSKNIPLYDTYAPQIEYAEEVRRSPDDKNILEVKCTYCGKWYIPKLTSIWCRIKSLNGQQIGESRLYCSDECKQECPIYRQKKYSTEENNTKKLSREVQPELRQMVLERDNYTCQKCGNTKSLHCHHIEGIRHDPLESADIDKCITYCKKCHKQVHRKEGCKYVDMQCKES